MATSTVYVVSCTVEQTCPKERQGIGGDMIVLFDNSVTKLPKSPFHDKLLPVIKGMGIVNGGPV